MSKHREALRKMAETTLAAVERGHYTVPSSGVRVDLKSAAAASKLGTQYFAPDCSLSSWKERPHVVGSSSTPSAIAEPTTISIVEVSSIDGIHLLSTLPSPSPSAPPQDLPRIGVLNFASATKPGGGFINGAQAQEESLARASTLYSSLMFAPAQAFYTMHKKDKKGGYYTHAMIYSPGVTFFRDDTGGWTEPRTADVLTCAAVNAGVARKTFFGAVGGAKEEVRIERVMRERMGRILYAFEREGVRHCVLGSFGTGVFQNDVGMVARIWADLLVTPQARFANSFTQVAFAIIGRKTFEEFKEAFEQRQAETSVADATTDLDT
jgi:uncharacterized protein (TIGR02452 family)